MRTRQKLIFALLLIFTVSAFYERGYFYQYLRGDSEGSASEYAFENQISNLQVTGSGTVLKILRDDTTGSRHQRIILQVGKEHTVLIAHNIDLAPRVDGIKTGDRLEFYGEYEYNSKGGVIHWTHRDPGGNHPDGWLKHQGRLYQ